MTTVTIELPDELAEQAKKLGILSSRMLGEIVQELVRRQAAEDLQGIMRRFDEQPASSLSPQEVQAIVRQVRATRA